MSLVVSDTSPIRALNYLHEIWLLERFYGNVLVPPAVADELASPRGALYPVDVSSLQFVQIRTPVNDVRVEEFLKILDRGESEALALAIEVHATALLIDEAAGRAQAATSGIPVVGVLGILGRAKKHGLITAVRSRMDALRHELQFRISDELYVHFLKSVGE